MSSAGKQKSLDDVLQEFSQHRLLMQEELQKIIVGQEEVIEQLFAAIFTRGHCLLEGVPGLAKTLMVSTVARILDVDFKRVQFTPDLMPSDITGTNVLDEDESGRRNFRFVEGPIFTNVLLADEINRTPPKTQAALLQAMQEREVSVGQETYSLPDPFFTIATQNPVEQEGTYPLPEAQLDRFMFNVVIDYPSFSEEQKIVNANTEISTQSINNILNKKHLLEYQKLVLNVPVSENVVDFSVKFVHNTRPASKSPEVTQKYIDWGAGPRASSFLVLASKAKAILQGKATPDIDDVKSVIKSVLRHRIILNFNAEAEGIKPDHILDELMKD